VLSYSPLSEVGCSESEIEGTDAGGRLVSTGVFVTEEKACVGSELCEVFEDTLEGCNISVVTPLLGHVQWQLELFSVALGFCSKVAATVAGVSFVLVRDRNTTYLWCFQ